MTDKIREFARRNWLPIMLALGPPAIGIVFWLIVQRDRTELTVTTLAIVPVVTIAAKCGEQIEVLYRGEPVQGLRIAEIEIRNTGSTAIDRSQYESPITLTVGTEYFLDPVLLEKSPPSLSPKLSVVEGKIEIEPLLLNSQDSFRFRTYVIGEGKEQGLAADARIRDVSEIRLRRDGANESRYSLIFRSVFSTVGVVVSVLALGYIGTRFHYLRLAESGLNTIVQRILKIETHLPEVVNRAERLAKQLDIVGHDGKAELLWVRLKIEGLLREIHTTVGLSDQSFRSSIRRRYRELVDRQIIDLEVARAIDDLLPTLNREIHDVDTYLSSEELESVVKLGLNVIAALNVCLERARGSDSDSSDGNRDV